LGSLILFSVWFRSNENRVEAYYANGAYPLISSSLDFLFGWLPFSIGDFLYTLAIGWLIYNIIRKGKDWRNFKSHISSLIFALGCIWLVFHFLWGFNYYRKSIPEQFGLSESKIEKKELIDFCSFTLNQILQSDSLLTVFKSTQSEQLAKPSLYGIIGNYMGYGGYYNPFTGEAQVNNYLPAFTLPYIHYHERAHQKGYAKESEANFIGYLDAMKSQNPKAIYSANLDLFTDAVRALRRKDSTLAKSFMEKLPKRAKNDLKEYRQFVIKYYGPIDRFITWFYSGYLQYNNQPEGMGSYGKGFVYVLRWLQKTKAIQSEKGMPEL
jgi:hypothetical protein